MKKRALRIIGRSPLTFGEGNIKGRIKNVLSDNLVFGDFKDFKGTDFSSNFNYRIMGYGVEGGFRLIVHTDGKQIDSTGGGL